MVDPDIMILKLLKVICSSRTTGTGNT